MMREFTMREFTFFLWLILKLRAGGRILRGVKNVLVAISVVCFNAARVDILIVIKDQILTTWARLKQYIAWNT